MVKGPAKVVAWNLAPFGIRSEQSTISCMAETDGCLTRSRRCSLSLRALPVPLRLVRNPIAKLKGQIAYRQNWKHIIIYVDQHERPPSTLSTLHCTVYSAGILTLKMRDG